MTPSATYAYDQVAAKARRDELIVRTLPLVRHVVGRILARLPAGVDTENLESAGTLGLVEAANRFDPERGIKFETYAYTRIRGAVLDELRRNCLLPQHMLEKVSRVRAAYAQLPPGATHEELARQTGMSADEIADCLAAMHLTHIVAWDETNEALERRDDSAESRPEAALEKEEQKQQLAGAIRRLDERERTVLTLYYLEDLRLKEIGALLQISESRVSRLLNAAIFNVGEFLRPQEV
jgi:RNA polymerase sigma factor for flagellar operon FliA